MSESTGEATAVTTLFFLSPRQIHTFITKKLRQSNTYELCNVLSDMCEEYWTVYCDVHEVVPPRNWDKREKKIQAFFKLQALVSILKEYGWWNDDHHLPKDWSKEALHEKDTS